MIVLKNSKSNSKARPLKIAVSLDFDPSIGFFMTKDIFRSLSSLGVEIIPLLYSTGSLKEILKKVDGVLIPGGLGDLDPQLYGQEKKFDNVKIIRERCDFEFRLLENYLPLEKPLLAICWGLQMVNVFLGGSLYQDIEQQRKSDIKHEQKEPKHLPTHSVDLAPKSRIAKIIPVEKLFVNSTHHQAIDRLAPTLTAEGHSPDGIVECFFSEEHPFCLGVQWHPERLADDPVIPAFLKATRRFRS